MLVKCHDCSHYFNFSKAGNYLCPHCGAPISVTGDGLAMFSSSDTSNPQDLWEGRGEDSIIKKFLRTIRDILFHPTEFFSTMSTAPSLSYPLAFAILVNWITSFVSSYWQFPLNSYIFNRIQTSSSGMPVSLNDTLFSAGTVIFNPIITLIMIFLISIIVYFLLIVLGEKNVKFKTVCRVISYSSAAKLFGVIPILGGFISLIWLFICQYHGLVITLNASKGRVLTTLFMPLIVILLMFFGFLLVAGLTFFTKLSEIISSIPI